MSDARAAVLGRIRAALGSDAPAAVPVPRDYDRRPLTGHGDVDRFAETVADYRARVHRVGPDEVATTISTLVGTGTAVIPADVPPDWVSGIRTVVVRAPKLVNVVPA